LNVSWLAIVHPSGQAKTTVARYGCEDSDSARMPAKSTNSAMRAQLIYAGETGMHRAVSLRDSTQLR
jgi:hypothetical protein